MVPTTDMKKKPATINYERMSDDPCNSGRSPEPMSVAIILLAAGRASRMGVGGPHKLLAEFAGVPLVRRSAERALLGGGFGARMRFGPLPSSYGAATFPSEQTSPANLN
ncbi:hypothetical protein Rleg4DRAFT_7669 [Rhizobium leguminosarum bv. trifolii WSM2297]|uniref:MobA-like NTP transferase domain-containing protein n=1 Tax=Rhizobium leguminosarum bv. trifolii WSM2297 TaxID=754762 RepID=J0CN87_RHILT|nr:NTP transferase domain-containing protein [Rhizobium leguminosarum]EJC85342.1 hypothetical protein Rleg4DRAFT_7222 [Rhizobium leguminosarum bv. trifolii WSM2297]EJC85774.1 hypothetical protein Rleg4DRAFT_7669 [Rhizobium leguminosarum bv. trifolii WSM2297]